MKYYAVLDTNVLVSAMLKAGSVPGLVTTEALIGANRKEVWLSGIVYCCASA